MRKVALLILLISLLAAACSGSDPESAGEPTPGDDPDGDGDPVRIDDLELTAALVPFDACEAFLDHVHAEAAARVGPYGLEGYGGYYGPVFATDDGVLAEPAEEMAEEPASEPARADGDDSAADVGSGDPAPAATGGEGGADGVEFSETNVQEQGVDEPDIVKTDGRRIVTVSENVITVVDVTGDEPATVGTIRLDGGWAREAFLAGDRLLLISDGDGGFVTPLAVEGDAEAGFAEDRIMPSYRQTTRVTAIDLSGTPTVTEVIEMEGRYLSARAVDGTARIVLTAPPEELPFLYPQSQAGEDRATDANREIVAESTVAQWVPDFQRRDPGGTVVDEGQLLPCDRIHRPEAFAGFEMLAVVGFDADGDSLVPVDTVGVLAAGETVYASTEALYVATNRWFDTFPVEGDAIAPERVEESYTTSLHKFSLADDGSADYRASGSVKGHLLNQFSLDEHDDRLRVATTAGSPWGANDTSESFVSVFEQTGGALAEVGRVGGLGKGERIFSVRFMDDVAYVVTFRQVDPFYVVDLSSPTDPAVVGELKIPGYSSYLHPIGDDLVLGVGQDADEEGFTRGAKVSLFDVSNQADPVEVAVWTGGADSYTDAEWDHRAFTWWAPDNLAILPISSWSDQFWGAVVLEVGPDGIVEKGRIDQQDPDAGTGQVAPECREVEPAEPAASFEDARTELDYIMLEGGKIVACDTKELSATPVTGFSCEGPIPVDEMTRMFGDDVELAEPLPADGFMHWCWPNHSGDPVVRTLIVDDDLYTMSWRWLQANDLASLERIARVPIN